MNPKRILISGDWHGEPRAAKFTARQAVLENCDAIVQLGDFGFWPHTDPDYIHQVNKALVRTDKAREGEEPLFMVWIDGNHENFDALYGTDWPRTPEGFWRIADRILYAPRGHRWTWSGVRCLALGGGHSIDKEWRLSQGPVGLYWWPQEAITQKNVYDCLAGGEVDVMFTHDMPEGTDLGIEMYKFGPEQEQSRMAVRAVVEGVRPRRLYHGHYHHRSDSVLRFLEGRPVEIVSLDMWHGIPRNETWVVLDLERSSKWNPTEKPLPRSRLVIE